MEEQVINMRLDKLEEQVVKIESLVTGMVNKIVVVEKDQQVISKELSTISKHTEAIMSMSYEVKNLATKMENAIGCIDKHGAKIEIQENRISEIVNKPGQVALKGWIMVITTIGTAILGFMIGTFI